MNKSNFITVLFLLCMTYASFDVMGQAGDTMTLIEKVNLFTDRSLYVAGEQVHFSALISSNDQQQDWSQVLYVETISPDGKSIVRNKFPISGYAAEGCLEIPAEIISGVYYLRAYTKYMRNQGPSSYAYAMIKIVNPFREEVMDGEETIELKTVENNQGGLLKISLDKSDYATREVVNVRVEPLPPSASAEKLWRSQKGGIAMSVSVIPESSSSEFIQPRIVVENNSKHLVFYPETRGVSITGEVNDASGNALAGAKVNLSIVGQGRDFMAVTTDSSGRFFISLPAYMGFRDLFLFAEKDSVLKPQVLVNNDFCSIPVHLTSPEFTLSADERNTVLAMAHNIRISTGFDLDSIPCSSTSETTDVPFYGVPTDVIYFDEYIPLPTLEEYFDELGTAVKVKKQNGLNYFKVIGTQPELEYFDPLVLVDWVAVNNIEKILAAPPPTIDRIEIVNVPYVKGGVTYGGIISIISKRGDFSGIDLPTSGVFLNYQGLADNCICPVIETDTLNLPDARNLVYWNPHLALDASNNAQFSFKTPDTPGRYSIVMNGVDGDGKKWRQSMEFVVKEQE